MKQHKILFIFIILAFFSLIFLFCTDIYAAIDPNVWDYEKTVNLFDGGTALIYFPQATPDNGENNHHLIEDSDDPNSTFENFFVNAQSGMFYLYYDGNDVIDEEILMLALGQNFDGYFFMGIQWQINDGLWSQNIPLESADFNSNEYGYHPQWWKVAQSGKALISTGDDEDTYHVIYVPLGFDGETMQKGDVLAIKYALSNFEMPGTQIIFNFYGSSDDEDFFRWTNKNTNTFGVNSTYYKAQQNQPIYPSYPYPYLYQYPGSLFAGYYGSGLGGIQYGSGYGSTYFSPTGAVYGLNFGFPYSFLGSIYGSGYGYSSFGGSYGGSYSSFGSFPYSSYSGWSYGSYPFFSRGFGSSFYGFGGYPFSNYYQGNYYGSFGGFYPYI